MVKKILYPVLVITTGLVGFALCYIFFPNPANIDPQKKIQSTTLIIADDNLIIPDGWIGQQTRHRLSLQNHAPYPITIHQLSASCDCLAISPNKPIVIPALGEIECEVLIDVKANSLPRSLSETTENIMTLYATICEDNSPEKRDFSWSLRQKVLTPIVVKPLLIDLGSVIFPDPLPVGECKVLVARDFVPRFEVDGPFEIKVIHSQSVEMGTEYVLAITSISSQSPPPLSFIVSGQLQIFLNGSMKNENMKTIVRKIPVKGETKPEVVASPNRIHFGRANFGETKNEEVAFFSLRNLPFQINWIEEKNGKDLKIEKIGNFKFQIQVPINQIGLQTVTLHGSATLWDGSVQPIEYQIQYEGIPNFTLKEKP